MAYSLEELYNLYRGGSDMAGQPITGEPAAEVDMSHEAPAAPGETQAPSTVDGYFAAQDTPDAPQGSVSAGTKQGGGYGVSASQGGSGYSEKKAALLDKRDAVLEKKKARSEAEVMDRYNPAVQAVDQSRASGQDAVQAKIDADMARLTDEQAAARFMEDQHNSIMNAEMQIHTRETAIKNKMMADYTASLADFAASKVDPNDLWHGMSGGMRFGTLVSAFVHDFLGAKGIKTSAMDNLNNAIKRNIDAQMYNINKKGEVAKGFKTLYDMESARSNSAEETRARIRTYMLEAAKNHIVANMSQYKSLLATAEGRKALAEVDKEYAKSYTEVVNHVEAASRARTQQDQQWEMHKAQMAQEAWRNSIAARANTLQERKWNDELEQRKAKALAMQHENTLIDPADNLGKKIIVRGSDKEHQNVREAMINASETNRALKEFRELAKKDGATVLDEAGVRRWTPEARKTADAIRYRLAHSQVKANGERATKEDVEEYIKMFPLDQVGTSGIEGMHAYAQNTTLKHANEYIDQYTEDLPKDKWTKAGDMRYFGADMAESGATYEQMKRGGMQKSTTDISVEAISRPDNSAKAAKSLMNKVGLDQTDVDMAWKDAVGQNKNLVAPLKSRGGDYYLDSRGGHTSDVNKAASGSPPAWAVGVLAIGQAARKGEPDAVRTLNQMATTDMAGGNKELFGEMSVDDITRARALAQYELLKMNPVTKPSQAPSWKPANPYTDSVFDQDVYGQGR